MCARLGSHFFETIKIHHHHIDGDDAVGLRWRHMFGVGAHGEDAAGDFGMHRLDASVQHLGESGDVADVGHRDAGVAQHSCGAAGGNELGAHTREGGSKFEESGFIGDAQQYARDLCHLLAR